MKNMYDVWVMDLDNMDPNKPDAAEHYMITAKSMSAAIAKVEEAYEDPEKGPERHFIIWAETKFNGEELPRDMYEIWDAEHMTSEEMGDLMTVSHRYMLNAVKEKRARRAVESQAQIDSRVQAAAEGLRKAIKAYDEPVCYTKQDMDHALEQVQKLSDIPYQE